ncbi:ECF RNA polymerase sigma factor SigK [Microbacterium candidum]|uniref:RNA polymerase sigma factor n=1 Tax=Microbacterium candidum TaxID=3041922 RepID=A0ABT7MWC9_9MICO|nr:ECF RNA polymerase sigma factor SigK [Microbacterium sp. ASV49]MDL9978760.1 ECF RNA polymerase sigma factor SigK [Microbacterium sp. ASV49]
MPDEGTDAVDVVGGLIQRTAQRDRDAFAQLYDMLAPRVLGLIVRVLVDRAQSEEILQEVFLEVWQSADRFAPNRGQGRTWLLTIAHRRAIDRVRSSQAGTDRDVRAGLRELAAPSGDITDQVALKIESERVAGALRTLPEVQREALVLAYYGGYSQSEIAVLTGAPLGTVKTRMRDGLTRLRVEMGVPR